MLRFDLATFELGLTEVDAAPGEPIRIYGPARTVVDMMRLRGRFGEPLAHGAVRRYLVHRDALPRDLITMARELDVLGPVRTALDIASAQRTGRRGRPHTVNAARATNRSSSTSSNADFPGSPPRRTGTRSS